MPPATITLQCDVTAKAILCRAIREYAHAAYPEGGSDCAQVARYTLLELAQQIDDGITPDNQRVVISRRPRAMVKAAIEYFYDRQDAASGSGSARQRELMKGMLRGGVVTGEELAAAVAADGGGQPGQTT
jgi:hypothetical protein